MVQQRFKSNALPGLMLVIIVFWALSAVLMLTSTLGNADKILERVNSINADVGPVNKKLDTVPILVDVTNNARAIRAAAAPLTGQLGSVVTDVGSIDTSAKSILVSANEINGKVKTINASATDINGQVHQIGSRLTTIKGTANEINGTVHSIGGSFVAINALVQQIQNDLVLTSKQVDQLTGQIQGIRSDTDTISPLVDKINGNAVRIRNSPIVLSPTNGAVMQQMAIASQMQPPGTAGVPDLSSILPQLQGLHVGPLPVVPLTNPLPLLGIPLQNLPLLGDTGLLSILR